MPTEKERKSLPTSTINVAQIRAALAAGSRKPAADPLVAPEAVAVGEIRAAADGATTDTRTSTPRAKSRATREN